MSTRKKHLIRQRKTCLPFIWKDMKGGDAQLIFLLELGLAMYFQIRGLDVCYSNSLELANYLIDYICAFRCSTSLEFIYISQEFTFYTLEIARTTTYIMVPTRINLIFAHHECARSAILCRAMGTFIVVLAATLFRRKRYMCDYIKIQIQRRKMK